MIELSGEASHFPHFYFLQSLTHILQLTLSSSFIFNRDVFIFPLTTCIFHVPITHQLCTVWAYLWQIDDDAFILVALCFCAVSHTCIVHCEVTLVPFNHTYFFFSSCEVYMSWMASIDSSVGYRLLCSIFMGIKVWYIQDLLLNAKPITSNFFEACERWLAGVVGWNNPIQTCTFGLLSVAIVMMATFAERAQLHVLRRA